jgi:kynurenine formamidase
MTPYHIKKNTTFLESRSVERFVVTRVVVDLVRRSSVSIVIREGSHRLSDVNGSMTAKTREYAVQPFDTGFDQRRHRIRGHRFTSVLGRQRHGSTHR